MMMKAIVILLTKSINDNNDNDSINKKNVS